MRHVVIVVIPLAALAVRVRTVEHQLTHTGTLAPARVLTDFQFEPAIMTGRQRRMIADSKEHSMSKIDAMPPNRCIPVKTKEVIRDLSEHELAIVAGSGILAIDLRNCGRCRSRDGRQVVVLA